MQQLWQIKVNLDDPLTTELKVHWHRLQHKLPMVSCSQIDRLVISKEELERIELHGFSDTNEAASGACIYKRSIDVQGKLTTKLLCSKSRVAPLRRLSRPRLELCPAMMLADMHQASARALKTSFNKIRFWTVSMIVLAWLESPAVRRKTFVAKRVNHIQETTNIEDWNHISSKENPADLLSRDVDPNAPRNSSLWWNGPNQLQLVETSWPKCEEIADISEERKPVLYCIVVGSRRLMSPDALQPKTYCTNPDEFCLKMPDFHVTFRDLLHAVNLRHGTNGFTSLPKEGVLRILRKPVNPTPVESLLTQPNHEEVFTKFSPRNKLQKFTAFCLRFIHNCRYKKSCFQCPLSPSELNEATLVWVERAQTDSFMEEKAVLTEKGLLSKES